MFVDNEPKGASRRMRKLILICIFLAGAVLGKPIALETVGLFAKAVLYFENGWRFSYGSVDWHEGNLIFKNVDLADPSFSLYAKRVSVFFSMKHLEIDQPRISIRSIPRLQKGRDEWTVEMKDGTLAHEAFSLNFSFEKTWRRHLGRFRAEKEGSRIEVEASRVDNEIWVDADLQKFQTGALKPWLDVRGEADGRVHLVFDGAVCKRGSAHLDFQEAGYGSFLSGCSGSLDWEGEIEGELLSRSLASMRLRLKVAKATLQGSKGSVEEVKGDCSFTAGVGARWEFTALGKSAGESFPISWQGRAFLHETRPFWAESVARGMNSRIALSGEQEENGFRWKGKGEGIGALESGLLLSLLSWAEPRFDALEFKSGKVGFEGGMLGSKEWKLQVCGENLGCEIRETVLQCKSAMVDWTSEHSGTFRFKGASVQLRLGEGKPVFAEEWEGEGAVLQGALVRSHFEGMVEKVPGAVAMAGTFQKFAFGARGKNFEAVLQCSWEERLDFVIEEAKVEGIAFGGAGWVCPEGFSVDIDRFEGPLAFLCQRAGFPKMEGQIESVGEGFHAQGNFQTADWFLQAKGTLASGLGFYCPLLEKRGDSFFFDLRIESPLWDLARLAGCASWGRCDLDPKRTHFLGEPIEVATFTFDSEGLESMEMKAPVSWRSLVAAAPLFSPEGAKWALLPIDGTALFDVAFSRNGGSSVRLLGRDATWKGEPVIFRCDASEEGGVWKIPSLQVDEWALSASAQIEGQTLRISEGKASWKKGLETDFYGHLDASLQLECQLPHLKVEIANFHALAASIGIPCYGVEGILEGRGMISHMSGRLEADFEVALSNLKAASPEASLAWQNNGPVHLRYASDAGICVSGLDLSGVGPNLPYFSCKVGLLEFDAPRSRFLLQQCRFDLPPCFLNLFKKAPSFLRRFNPEEGISFCADLDCPSDFSSLSFSVKEASLPLLGTSIPIRNLSFFLSGQEIETHFDTEYQSYPVKVSCLGSFDEEFCGRLTLEDGDGSLEAGERPLSIDGAFSETSGLAVREVVGQFGGVEAAFHALDGGSTLIGSARVDFGRLSKIVPPRIAQVFSDLSMGKGYELKGKLFLDEGVSFSGLFTGKQIDLFGYQLRTLLSQFEFSEDLVRLYDLKISDSAGILTIDEILAAANGEAPWTLTIPHLTITELRPSLLQIPNREPEPAGPLVVRELKIEDFKGLLEESKTYTAKGNLTFINSFRREHTLFDIPSDLLGRIVGLDLELLIPASGCLEYELKDGLFTLTSLYDSFSEGRRSEFFLVPDPPPTMDLDGNLDIRVSMKQFVLFKLTESFQILIDGKLDDPQFHLQKKRRFLGL
jgi:hypothetical protein